jgi:hypothetical protein
MNEKKIKKITSIFAQLIKILMEVVSNALIEIIIKLDFLD